MTIKSTPAYDVVFFVIICVTVLPFERLNGIFSENILGIVCKTVKLTTKKNVGGNDDLHSYARGRKFT